MQNSNPSRAELTAHGTEEGWSTRYLTAEEREWLTAMSPSRSGRRYGYFLKVLLASVVVSVGVHKFLGLEPFGSSRFGRAGVILIYFALCMVAGWSLNRKEFVSAFKRRRLRIPSWVWVFQTVVRREMAKDDHGHDIVRLRCITTTRERWIDTDLDHAGLFEEDAALLEVLPDRDRHPYRVRYETYAVDLYPEIRRVDVATPKLALPPMETATQRQTTAAPALAEEPSQRASSGSGSHRRRRHHSSSERKRQRAMREAIMWAAGVVLISALVVAFALWSSGGQ